ncbi:GTP-binding protein [Escherichia coli]
MKSFFPNMMAGVGGIHHALLVVACDDGVMAQTREHLVILQLTGNPMLTVALTKADRVDEARVDEVERQVKEVLRNTVLLRQNCLSPQQPKVGEWMPCASICFSCRNASTPANIVSASRLTCAFTVKGAGLVVTGTALSGEVKEAIHSG